MFDPDPRPPLLPRAALGFAKIAIGAVAVLLAVTGGLVTFAVAGIDGYEAIHALLQRGGTDTATVAVVKAIDALLLGLVQFLLASYLWQILDPRRSLLEPANTERLEEAKQILCKVVLVILAVRMLGIVIEAELQWTHVVLPLGIAALAFATTSLQPRAGGREGPRGDAP